MMNKQLPPVAQVTFSFQHTGKTIRYDVWQTESGTIPRNVLFLGAAQVGTLGKWVAQHCPPSTIVVQGLPHWLVDDEDISTFAITYTKEAFKAVIAHFRLKKVNILVESQATPSVMKLFSSQEFENHLGNLVLIQPLGLNQKVFTSAPDPFSLFLRRTAQNAKRQGVQLFDRMFYQNARQLTKHLDLRNPNFRIHYTTGLQQDIASELKTLYDRGDHHVTIICGANDQLFSPVEIKQTLRLYNISIPIQQIPKIPHSPLATRHGLKLLETAFEALPEMQKSRY